MIDPGQRLAERPYIHRDSAVDGRVKSEVAASDWMFPSKMSPTISPALLITGEPELPPIMSFVVTKFMG